MSEDLRHMQEEAERLRLEKQKQAALEAAREAEEKRLAAPAPVGVPIPPATGAERVATGVTKVRVPEITARVAEVGIGRVQKNIEQVLETTPKVQENITKLSENISNLSKAPGRYTIEDPNTGVVRPVTGSDIERMMTQKADLEKWLTDSSEWLVEAQADITGLEYVRDWARSEKAGSKYVVRFVSDTGKAHTIEFDTETEAELYTAKLNAVILDKAITRTGERTFVGLSLQEAAEVIRQEKKGPVKVTEGKIIVGTGNYQLIEELIEQNRVSPEQVVEWSKGNQIEVKIITSEPIAKAKEGYAAFDKIIGDQITLIQDDIRVSKEKYFDAGIDLYPTKIGRARTAPLTGEEWAAVVARADITGRGFIIGSITAAAAMIDLRTPVKVVKGVGEWLKSPIASTVATATALKVAYDVDPLVTSGVALGAVTTAVMLNVALRPVKSVVLQGTKKAVGGTLKRIHGATEAFWEDLKVPSTGDLAMDLKAEVFRELAMRARMSPADPNTLKVLADPLAAPALFESGPSNFWDSFRHWAKFDFTYIPADPSKATTGVYNKYVEFLNIQAAYLSDRLTRGRTAGTFGEFIQTKKVTLQTFTVADVVGDMLVIRPPTGIEQLRINMGYLSRPFFYWLVKKMPMGLKGPVDAATIATLIEQGELPELRFDKDYRIDGRTYEEYVKVFKNLTAEDAPTFTKEQLETALRAFHEAITLETEGPMAPLVQTALIEKYLTDSGVSKAVASTLASDYAFGLVVLSSMSIAPTSEIPTLMADFGKVLDRIEGVSDAAIRHEMMADLLSQLSLDIQLGKIRGLQPLMDKALRLQKHLEDTGEIDTVLYNELMRDITDISPVQVQDEAIDIITPIVIPPEQVVVEEPPKKPDEPRLPRADKDIEDPAKLRLRLWAGPKERYRVKFSYPAGRGETLTVEARSFPEAVNKGQRGRRGNRYLPSVVDVTRV